MTVNLWTFVHVVAPRAASFAALKDGYHYPRINNGSYHGSASNASIVVSWTRFVKSAVQLLYFDRQTLVQNATRDNFFLYS